MQVIHERRAMQAHADAERAAGRRIALVPTMGALHAGHLALVREAARRADRVVVSIFVNPTQFDDPGDLAGYPRTWDEDLARCREEGVDVVYAPRHDEVYPEGAQTWVEVAGLSRPLCGRTRPGHFRGVTTVVPKLFLAVKPHCAVFGEKDFQQLAIVRRMVRDLGFDVEIVGHPTVREADGVALSSRNTRLDPEARIEARVLVRALEAAQGACAAGERRAEALLRIATHEIAKAARARIDYAELRDPDTLEPAPAELAGPTLLALAVVFRTRGPRGEDTVRLIDNRVLEPDASPDAPVTPSREPAS